VKIDVKALQESAARATPADVESYLTEDDSPQEIPEGVETAYTRNFLEWEGFFGRDFTDEDWLVEPLLARGRSHALVAEAKTGKSLLAFEIALALSTGREVLHRPAGDPIHVLYADHEMTEVDVWERAQAMGYGPDDERLLNEFFHYSLLPAAPPADTEAGGIELALTAALVGSELVILDTYSRAVAGAENDADTTRNFFTHSGRLLKEGGITVLRLDHMGKESGRGGRGSSAKNDDVDVVYNLTKTATPNTFDLKATHTRMGWVPREQMLYRTEDPLTHEIKGEVTGGNEEKILQVMRHIETSGQKSNQGMRLWLRSKNLQYSNGIIQEAVRRYKEQGDTPL
jgi:hypothetical protein